MKILILMSMLLSFPAIAQVFSLPITETVSCPPAPACPSCPPCLAPVEERSSATNRENSFGTLMGGFQLINTWVPNKLTGSYTQILNREFSLELEYATSQKQIDIAGTELGTLKENRFSLLAKYFIGKSFNISLGPYVNDIAFKLGDNIKDLGGNRVNGEISILVYGVAFGIGNRWQLDNGITFGIDWLRMNQPTGAQTSNEGILNNINDSDKDDAKRTGMLFRTAPSFTYLGVNVGYTF